MMSEVAILDRLISHDSRVAKFTKVLNDERAAAALDLSDVARMLGLEVDIVLAIAAGNPPGGDGKADLQAEPPAAWLAPGSAEKRLDLRPVFDRGQEPLAMILDAVARLPHDTDLIIDAPFHPLPLRRLLGGRGFDSSATQLSPAHWRVTFRQAWAPGWSDR